MWSVQRSMMVHFIIVCGIVCWIYNLSGTDRKSVHRMGNYGNAVSLSWHSDTHLKRLTGHRVNTTSKQCVFGSSVYPVYTTAQYPFLAYNRTTVGLLLETDDCVTVGLAPQTTMTQSWQIPNLGFVTDIEDVPGVQDIWQIQVDTCEHRSKTSIEISHVRSTVSMSNCYNNFQTVHCSCVDCIVMDLPVDKVDTLYSASSCCSYLPTTHIVCFESIEDSLWCYNTCVSVQCYGIPQLVRLCVMD